MKLLNPNFYIEFANAKLDSRVLAEFLCDDPTFLDGIIKLVEKEGHLENAIAVQWRLKKALHALIFDYESEHLEYFLKMMETVTWHSLMGWSEHGDKMPELIRRGLVAHTGPANAKWYTEQGWIAIAAALSLKQAMQNGRIEKLKICVGACCGRFHERKSDWCSDAHKKRFKTRAKFASWIDLDEMYSEEEWEARLRCPVLKSLHEMLYY